MNCVHHSVSREFYPIRQLSECGAFLLNPRLSFLSVLMALVAAASDSVSECCCSRCTVQIEYAISESERLHLQGEQLSTGRPLEEVSPIEYGRSYRFRTDGYDIPSPRLNR